MRSTLALAAVLLVGLSGCSSSNTPWYGQTGRATRYPSSRSYPASAKTTQGGQERYVICHNGRTQTLPTPAIDAHLRHGDRFGACSQRGSRGQARGNAGRRGRDRGQDRGRDRRDDRDDDDRRGRGRDDRP